MSLLKKATIRHSLFIILIFLVLTTLRLLWLVYFLPSDDQPTIQEGVFDIRDQQLPDEKGLSLDGEWLYYPGLLIDPLNTDHNKSLRSFEQATRVVPTRDSETTAERYGSYRLKILLNDNASKDHRYAIEIPSVSTASALYINGKLVEQSGTVATDSQNHQGQAAPYTFYFTNEQPEIDLILHVSNFDTSAGPVIDKRILFGSAAAMAHQQMINNLSLATISIALILFALFSTLVFLFIHPKPVVLLFTVGFLLPLSDELVSYDRSILTWLHLNYVWSFKLSTIIYLGASFFFVQFMRVLLVKYRHAKCFQWVFAFYALSAFLTVVLPINWLNTINSLYYILYVISFLSVVVLALREYLGNQKQSTAFIALTALGTINGIMWGYFKSIYNFDIPTYPFDYLFIMLGFASYWFKRFFENQGQINQLIAKLQKDDALKDEFLSSSSQKLWDPMNKMITLGQSIYDNPNNKLMADDKQNLKHLIDIGRSMSFTLNDIQDFTRLKEGKLHLHKKNVSIQSVVYGVFDMLRFITSGKQIQMNAMIPRSFPHVVADENRLIQILFNLLHNAIKYTSAGSIIISARIENNMAVIHIRDTGLGMDNATQSRLFSPYEQENDNNNGIGLGLLISKKLIELHGGTLHIHSIPDKGSDVYFTLPLAKADIKEEQPFFEEKDMELPVEENKVPAIMEKRFNILMVDDDPVNLTIMRSLFATTEYAVTTVTSSEKALELLQQDEWDLVIIDAMLPYISGYALTEILREHYSLLELPVLILTARNYPEDVYIGFAHGANDYVTKPINSLELKVRSRALIDLKYSINQRLHLETAWLQAQIQPHFLFNTLNSIASLSTIDTDRMIDLMHHFGEYLHASFDVRNLQRVVPLKDELELVRSYLYINQQRFGDLLNIEWDIDDHINIEIPPISLQTLVENAIRHGVLKQEEGGTVCIRIKDFLDYVAVSVIDDGVGIDPSIIDELQSGSHSSKSGVGLRNTDLRLKRIYGQRLQIKSTINEGTNITFHIPKK
ncbi:ATP-binding protein [Lysinibacillus sp. BPa_S21]|uniref:hybrid sensor histidine kinase/response regulator n=1 Tax=Lysinibacillus sp. BPa_S21 TaxID=2932478 RepID=UPI002010D3E9|nr:ATP-binding protein [Lysinibacillus sp. BPa_S21]MCL1697970.1 ATP-binding protein [Lysinibacillus sp. BPa_S21]